MKRTKTKLVSSIVTLLICFAMLIGSTFAWFTDSASTGVNKIQAGNLDVQLLDASGNSLEGKTLSWQKAAEHENEKVLWEPGCKYQLQPITIKNNGNLNLKYKIEITGIQGDAKLNEAIEWSITDTNTTSNLSDDHPLARDSYDILTIEGHMKEDAGNEYKNLTIDGISITVYATQAGGEYDSFGNNYDAGAEYVKRTATIMRETDGKTYTLESGETYTVGNAEVKVDNLGNISYENTSGLSQTVTITTDGGTLTVNAPLDTVKHYGEANIVGVTAIANNSFHEFGKVSILSIASGRIVAENGNNIDIIQVKGNDAIIAVPENKTLETKLEKASNVTNVVLNVIDSKGTAVVSKSINTPNGIVEGSIPEELKEVLVNTGSSSTPTINDAKDYVARVEDNYYDTLDAAINAAGSDDTVALLKDSDGKGIGSKDGKKVRDSLTIDFNGHTYTMNDPAVGSSGTETQAMHWGTSLGAVTLKNGTFKVGESTTGVKMAMQNYINFTAENMTFDFSNIPVTKYGTTDKFDPNNGMYKEYSGLEVPMFNNNNNTGKMILKNSTITMPESSVKGISNDGNEIMIDSCTINGAVVMVSANKVVKVKDSVITKGVSPYFNSSYTVKTSEANGYTVYTNQAVVNISKTEELNKAITNAADKNVNISIAPDQTITLDNGVANEGNKSRNITFIGNGSQTVDVITNTVTAEGGQLNYQRGSTFTFENLTIKAGEGSFDGIVCDELTFKDCTIKGKLALYGKATFINCTFENTMANQYSIWTWGGTDVKFEGCTFNTNGKAILLYGGASGTNPTNLVVNNCTFNDRNKGAAGKAAIEIGNDYNATYTLTVNNATVNGFADGLNTGSKLWANKNSMDAAHLTVTIDGNQAQ